VKRKDQGRGQETFHEIPFTDIEHSAEGPFHHHPTSRRTTFLARKDFEELHKWLNGRTLLQDAQKDRPARPQREKARGVPLGYVEGLNDARTKLADFFSILLCLKMFAQGQTLALIRGPECSAIELTGACEHLVVYNLKKCLSIMDEEGHVVGADLEDHLSAV
jgi:hypothetical protein